MMKKIRNIKQIALAITLVSAFGTIKAMMKESLEDQLRNAVYHNQTQEAQRLINADANVDTVDRFSGYTPLSLAVENQNKELVKLLTEANANPNTKNNAGWAPLHTAIRLRDKELVALLIAAGADPTIEIAGKGPFAGKNAFDMATDIAHEEIKAILQTSQQ